MCITHSSPCLSHSSSFYMLFVYSLYLFLSHGDLSLWRFSTVCHDISKNHLIAPPNLHIFNTFGHPRSSQPALAKHISSLPFTLAFGCWFSVPRFRNCNNQGSNRDSQQRPTSWHIGWRMWIFWCSHCWRRLHWWRITSDTYALLHRYLQTNARKIRYLNLTPILCLSKSTIALRTVSQTHLLIFRHPLSVANHCWLPALVLPYLPHIVVHYDGLFRTTLDVLMSISYPTGTTCLVYRIGYGHHSIGPRKLMSIFQSETAHGVLPYRTRLRSFRNKNVSGAPFISTRLPTWQPSTPLPTTIKLLNSLLQHFRTLRITWLVCLPSFPMTRPVNVPTPMTTTTTCSLLRHRRHHSRAHSDSSWIHSIWIADRWC